MKTRILAITLLVGLMGLSLACTTTQPPQTTKAAVTDAAVVNPTPNPNPQKDKDVQRGYDQNQKENKEKREQEKRDKNGDKYDVKKSGDTAPGTKKP